MLDVLDERPALRRPATARSLGELVAHERTRQDARLSSMRRVRGEAEALFCALSAVEEHAPKGLRARIGDALRRSSRGRRTTEADLRARYEGAQVRARRAVVFAESLASLEGELATEVKRLNELLVDLAHDESALDALRTRVRTAADELEGARASTTDPVRVRELEAALDKARARANALETERDRVHDAEDRLLGLVEGERMIAVRLAHVRVEVERAAHNASKRLDDVADAVRALVTAEDAQVVVAELERALERLIGSLKESARLARDTGDALATGASQARREQP